MTDLSATYFDIVKDRLYTDSPNSPRRRATQTVLYDVLQTLPRLIAPITPFLAEEIYSSMQKDLAKSVFEDGYYEMKKEWNNPSISKVWKYTFAIGFYVDSITVVKSEINRELEKLKKEGTIKSSLEVDVSVLSGRRNRNYMIFRRIYICCL